MGWHLVSVMIRKLAVFKSLNIWPRLDNWNLPVSPETWMLALTSVTVGTWSVHPTFSALLYVHDRVKVGNLCEVSYPNLKSWVQLKSISLIYLTCLRDINDWENLNVCLIWMSGNHGYKSISIKFLFLKKYREKIYLRLFK